MPEDMCKHGFELLAVVLHVRRVPKTFAGDEGSGILANELVMSAGRHRAVKLLAGSNRSCLGGRSQDLISMVTATLQQVMGREKITFCSSAELLKKIHTKRGGREVLRVCAGSAWAAVGAGKLLSLCTQLGAWRRRWQLQKGLGQVFGGPGWGHSIFSGDMQHPAPGAAGSPQIQCQWLSLTSLVWCSG